MRESKTEPSAQLYGVVTDRSHRPHRLLSAARPAGLASTGSVVLPMSSGVALLPNEPAFVKGRPQGVDLIAHRLVVSDPDAWRISWLRLGPRIGGAFVDGADPALTAPGPESTARLPPVAVEGYNQSVEIEITYVGSDPAGKQFVGCLLAAQSRKSRRSDDPVANPSPTNPLISPEVHHAETIRTESRLVPRLIQSSLRLPPRAHDLHLSDLTLRVTNPEHWIVNEVMIGGDTLLVNSGDLPGVMFTDHPERVPLRLGRLRTGEEMVVEATYFGPLDAAMLAYEVSGTEVPTGASDPGDSAFLSLTSGVAIIPHGITARVDLPRGYAFVVEDLILRDPGAWAVEDIKVGNESQFAQSGDAPGEIFGAQTRGRRLDIRPIGDGMDLVVHLRYRGTEKASEPIVCGVVGRIVRVALPT